MYFLGTDYTDSGPCVSVVVPTDAMTRIFHGIEYIRVIQTSRRLCLPKDLKPCNPCLRKTPFSAFSVFSTQYSPNHLESCELQEQLLLARIAEAYRGLAVVARANHRHHIADAETFVLDDVAHLQTAHGRRGSRTRRTDAGHLLESERLLHGR